ncbi:uncharacterized protein LY79DRAFT_28384 [Colletotrichum navitas]|uniref:Uncharacterized protein n=1 Tax=Colletotrichum navitas TaxID=681940 RepID=A0AAD8QDS8_9PEZI|nr:uncharacterized protein LY79DRAFT_28384 [Colletotrichum navitas]KAK1600675.1 hypothetical protein LY79DRAFT_28384 [Colletotrichum navitas]
MQGGAELRGQGRKPALQQQQQQQQQQRASASSGVWRHGSGKRRRDTNRIMEGPWAGTGRDPWDGHLAPLALAEGLGRAVANDGCRPSLHLLVGFLQRASRGAISSAFHMTGVLPEIEAVGETRFELPAFSREGQASLGCTHMQHMMVGDAGQRASGHVN